MSKDIRDKILHTLADKEHSENQTGHYSSEKVAELLNLPRAKIEEQMDILESQGLIQFHKGLGPTPYSANITPQGRLSIED